MSDRYIILLRLKRHYICEMIFNDKNVHNIVSYILFSHKPCIIRINNKNGNVNIGFFLKSLNKIQVMI